MAVVDGNEGWWSSAFWPKDFWPIRYWPNTLIGYDDRVTHMTVLEGTVVAARYAPDILHIYEGL